MKTLKQRIAGVACSRCGERRWLFRDWTEPSTCSPCRTALAGGRARDSKAGERLAAQQAVSKALATRRQKTVSLLNYGR
jgi:hypothetical protein